MPRRTQVAKTQPKRKRSTSRNPTAEDLLKRCAARKPPRGELTAAEAIKDPSSGLAKAVALIGEQNSGLVKLVARTGEQLAAAWEPLMKQLRANDGLMQQVAAAAVQTQRDLEEIAPSCLEPDGHLNRTKFEARARVRLGLESGELWCMPMYEIVAQFREKANYDEEQQRGIAQKNAEELEELVRYMVARFCTENVAAVLDHQSETLGEMICSFRLKAGITQYDLALQARVNESTVKRWEGDKAVPTRKNTRRIAKALNIPAKTLLDRRNAP